jgi:hypothetical protein
VASPLKLGIYSLSKKPEMNIRRYEHNGNWLEVIPSFKGLATIYDKDILIYAISQIDISQELVVYLPLDSLDTFVVLDTGYLYNFMIYIFLPSYPQHYT